MTSVLISSPSRMDNVYQGRTLSGSASKQQQSLWENGAMHMTQVKNASSSVSCGARSRLLSLPIQSADVSTTYQENGLTMANGYESALRRQLVTSSSSSDDGVSPSSSQIDVYQIAQALAHFGIAPPSTVDMAQRPKNILERSISVPSETNSLKYQQLQLQQQQQQQQPVNASRYKTEMCRPFEEHGFCKYGEKCQFAHGIQELRSVSRHPKYKTELCRTFHTVGFCAYGSRCHFVHNEDERAASQPPQRASPPLSVKTSPVSFHSSAAASRNGGIHLPLIRCGSLGSTADSPPASPIDACPPTPSFHATSSRNGVTSVTSGNPHPLSILTLDDISSWIASLQGNSGNDVPRYTSPPSPPDSVTYGSDGCYEITSSSASMSSAESSPTKCALPSAFVGRVQPSFNYYN